MITKITSRLTPIVKQPIRANLQKASIIGLATLAGSSMPSGDVLLPSSMVIPGGLDMREKAYYLLTGKLPDSVYSRWTKLKSDYVPSEGDQVVSVNIDRDGRIGEIIEGPHGIGTKTDTLEPLNGNPHDILSPEAPFIDGDLNGDGELSKEELLIRFLGQY